MNTKHSVTLIGLCLLLVSNSPAADLGTRRCKQWVPCLQWSLENPEWEGSTFDVRAHVVYTHEASKKTIRTEMFYESGQKWAFRFTGVETGRWSFRTSSDDQDLNAHTGQIFVEPIQDKSSLGFLANIDGHWGWQATGDVFVPQLVMWDYATGSNSPRLMIQDPRLIDRKIAEFMDGHGFNGFHVPVIAGRWFNIDAKQDRIDRSMRDPDQRTFRALELLILKTHRAGGFVHIWPWGDHSRSQTPRSLDGGIGGHVDQRLQRYMAARLGPIPGWSMGYGFDLDEWVSAQRVTEWRDAMHERMGWHHFLGGRPVGPNHGTDHRSNARWNRGLDYASYEHHRPTYEVYLSAVRATPGKPVMSEDRFRIREGRYPEKDYNAQLTRRGLYHSSMGGGVANIWGMSPELSPDGSFPNKHEIKTYSIFFNEKKRFLRDMSPTDLGKDTMNRVLLSRSTNSLVLYTEDADSIQIDLSQFRDPQPVVAVDTRKTYAEIDLGALEATKQSIKLGTKSDWVIAVGTFGQAK